MYNEGLLAVRAKLKGGKMRYVPMPPELADELRRFMPQPANNVLYITGNNDERIFRRKTALRASARAYKEVLKTCSKGQESRTSAFMISVTRLHRGT
jgi:hypothetical protein